MEAPADQNADSPANGDSPDASVAAQRGIVCAPGVGRRPSERGFLMAMQQRSRNAALQTRLVFSVLNLPNGVFRRSSSLVHSAMDLAEGALGAIGGIAKNTTATVQQAMLGGKFLLEGVRFNPVVIRPPAHRTYAGTMEAMAFVRNFNVEYGHIRPDFEKCSLTQAMSRAVQEYKFFFAYLHSLDHANTSDFCQRTLCYEPFVQFVNANFVSWGADIRGSEGFQISICLHAQTFPFCAVIAASSPQHMVVLQQAGKWSGIWKGSDRAS